MKYLIKLIFIISLFSISCQEKRENFTIFLAGDSTMAPKKENKRPETGWGEMLIHFIDSTRIKIDNHARNGRSTRTFISEGRWENIVNLIKPGDMVFIQFGHNDQSEQKVDRYTPPDQFSEYLEKFITEVIDKDGKPILFTPVVRRRFDKNNEFYDVHGVYPDLTRTVAEKTGTLLVDHHRSSMKFIKDLGAVKSKEIYLWLEPGESPNYPEGLQDNTHFSPEGARRMAELAINDMKVLGLNF